VLTFLVPAFLIAAGVVAGAVVVIHFIVTRDPRTVPLPTARFAPARPIRAEARAVQPQDLLLLLLRTLMILAVGAALAQPVLRPPRRALVRIFVVDRSRAVANGGEVADSVRARFTAGDALVLFDSMASVIRDNGLDSLARLEPVPYRGRLSAALIAALRTASAMRERADSIELVVVSPLVSEELDDATDTVRALWPGAIRLVRVTARRDPGAPRVIAIEGPGDDPLRLALPRGSVHTPPTVRIVRGPIHAVDSTWARGGARVLVHWPIGGGREVGALGDGWVVRTPPDTVGAVSAGAVVVVAPLARWAVYRPGPRSGASADGGPPRAVARWVDGEPAAVEERYGAGCIRTVSLELPVRGDLVLEPRLARLVEALTERCGGEPAFALLDEARIAALARSAASWRVPGAALPTPDTLPTPLVPWLLAAALVLALGELLLRRRIGRAPAAKRAGESAA
jgi:hypothetical protein